MRRKSGKEDVRGERTEKVREKDPRKEGKINYERNGLYFSEAKF